MRVPGAKGRQGYCSSLFIAGALRGRSMVGCPLVPLLAIRLPRVFPSSDGHFDSRDSLHVGAQISETGGHQSERTAFRIRQRCSIEFVNENTVIPRLLERETD